MFNDVDVTYCRTRGWFDKQINPENVKIFIVRMYIVYLRIIICLSFIIWRFMDVYLNVAHLLLIVDGSKNKLFVHP